MAEQEQTQELTFEQLIQERFGVPLGDLQKTAHGRLLICQVQLEQVHRHHAANTRALLVLPEKEQIARRMSLNDATGGAIREALIGMMEAQSEILIRISRTEAMIDAVMNDEPAGKGKTH